VTFGWRLDREDFCFVQLTRPGSGCSVQFGMNITSAAPGTAGYICLTVSNIDAARDALVGCGVEVSQVFHEETRGPRFHCIGRLAGPSPRHSSFGSFVSFSDPDGNSWLLQEVTHWLSGRIDPAGTSLASASDLAGALRRASAAHGEHEKRIGTADPNWPDWDAQ
jgi:hypothetical protein